MVAAKQIVDWIYNVVLAVVAVINIAGVFVAETIAQKWMFGVVGVAFSVVAFFFIRASLASSGKVQE